MLGPVALLRLIPLLAATAALAAPVEPIAAGLDRRQQRGGGNWGGDAGRPTGSWRNGQGASGATGAPVSPTVEESSATAAASSQPAAGGGSSAAGGASSASTSDNAAATGSAGSTSGGSSGSDAASEDSDTDAGNSGNTGTSGDTGTGSTSDSDSSSDTDTGTTSDSGTDSSSDTGSGNTGNTGGSGGSGGPVGTGWDAAENPSDLSSYKAAGLQWWYDWQLSPVIDSDGVEFVPMVKNSSNVAEVANAMGNWPSGTKNVLSFNEPDKEGQVGGTKMSPADGAKYHNELVDILGGEYSVSTPGVARDGQWWMDEWIAECDKLDGCDYDFTAFHYYGTDAQDLISSVQKMYDDYGKEVWLTEWACYEFGTHVPCTPEEVETFMTTAIEWFRGEGASIVPRWAWFGAFHDMSNWQGTDDMDTARIANADGTVNALGEKYLSM